MGRWIKRWTEITLPGGVRDEADLATGRIREMRRIEAAGDRAGDLLSGKVGSQKALLFREAATDIATQADPAGHELRQRSDVNQPLPGHL
jgi:hypothetical protein